MSVTFACSDMCIDEKFLPRQSYDDAKRDYYERLRTNFELYEVDVLFSTKLNLTTDAVDDSDMVM